MSRKLHILTDDEKVNVCKLYLVDKLSITEITNIYNASMKRVRCALVENNISIDSRGKRGNRFIVKGDTVKIELRRRNQDSLWTTIDIGDLEKVIGYNYTWHAAWRKKINGYYAVTTEHLGVVDGKQKSRPVYLHRFLLDADPKIDIDHVNHDTLDNRKENLKCKTRVKNSVNRKGRNKNNVTGHRNVAFVKADTKTPYWVQLSVEGIGRLFGKFDNPEEAGKLAKELRIKHYGEDAVNS